jgi:hypothetical protein
MLHFKTKIDCEAAIRNKIKEIWICDDVKDELLITYTKQHALWIDGTKLGIETDDTNWNNLRCYFIMPDGDKRVFSWLKILRPETFKTKIAQAYRDSINYTIKDFRNNNPFIKCEWCKNTDKLHVDHIYEFKNIVKDFETKYDIIWDKSVKYFERTEIHHRKFKDNDFNNKFIEHHNSYANNYRVLCSICNIQRNRKTI